MKVKDLKKQLENYSDDEQILILYWDKDFANDYSAGVCGDLSNDQWEKVVSEVESKPMWQIEDIGDIIASAVDKVVSEEADVNANS